MAKKETEAKKTGEKKPTKKTVADKPKAAKASSADKQAAKTKPTATKAAKPTKKAVAASKAKAVASKVGNAAAITSLAAKGVKEEVQKKEVSSAPAPVVKAEPVRKVEPMHDASRQSRRENQPSREMQAAQSQKNRPHEVVIPLTSGAAPAETQPTFSEPPSAEMSHQGGKRNKRRRNKQRNNNNGGQERPQFNQDGGNREINIKKLCKKAWQIYSAEVAEEGIALMDDNTSREAAKRAFRVAEWFLLEESRRKHFAGQKNGEHDAQPSADKGTAEA